MVVVRVESSPTGELNRPVHRSCFGWTVLAVLGL